jgi:hypothetical protein
MWWRSVRDDKNGSRGQDGSPSDPDGLGIPSRSAPASTREILIDRLESAVRELKADGDRIGQELLLNLALSAVEQAIQRWRVERPSSRSRGLFARRGRPSVLDEDVKRLTDLRNARPGSECEEEFVASFGRSLHRQQILVRYRRAHKKISAQEHR